MDLGLDRALRAAERLGGLGDAQPIDVAQDHGGPHGRRQRQEGCRQLALRLPAVGRGVGPGTAVTRRIEAGLDDRLQRERGVAVVVPATLVPGEVDRDRREPRPEAQFGDPGWGIAGHRPVRPDERVLGHLLGVAPIAQQSERDRVQPIRLGLDQPREGRIEVAGELRGQGDIGLHRLPQHRRPPIGCSVPQGSIRGPRATPRRDAVAILADAAVTPL